MNVDSFESALTPGRDRQCFGIYLNGVFRTSQPRTGRVSELSSESIEQQRGFARRTGFG
jgi:hypothetical protein